MTPEMKCLLEAMRDDPGSVSSGAAAGGAAAALSEIERLRAGINRAGALCLQRASTAHIRDVLSQAVDSES